MHQILAAVDLGSNSFHLQVARVEGQQIYALDSLREPVRLGAGLTAEKRLDEASQERALDCLRRFGERLRGLPRSSVRVVGTNSLRVAKNASAFLAKAQAALGFPIEVIAGLEEARLIYLGVAHKLPLSKQKRLIVDIGGGSTELIIGSGFKPDHLESLYMGCVSYSLRYFPDGKISKSNMQQAVLAARNELQVSRAAFDAEHWQEAVGSSGTARALEEIMQASGFSESGITEEGLDKLCTALLKAGDSKRVELAGLRPDRAPVLPGGLAIMQAVFSELEVRRMATTGGALREGILYDLLGRIGHHDMRDVTVQQFTRRYHIDMRQAKRVEALASALFKQLAKGQESGADGDLQLLMWAAKLHEIGISISHSSYHKHGAYIINNADMPGFSKNEQSHVSMLLLAHRGSLKKIQGLLTHGGDSCQVLALRLATLFCRSRTDVSLPQIRAKRTSRGFDVAVDGEWLSRNPLTEASLQDEVGEWKKLDLRLEIKTINAVEDAA
ncbi:MAG TPA: exopolyphosphatase [Burkholderiales bacterium]|nr:exopolyphosphatase [Burkholderiales bacterium]